jgi:hypothetical protein
MLNHWIKPLRRNDMSVHHLLPGQIATIVGPAKVTLVGGEVAGIEDLDPPVASALSPDTAVVGGPDITCTVTGTGFTPFSKITFNGTDEVTEFISETELSTIVKPSTASGPWAIPVAVRTGGMVSEPLTFQFTEAGAGRRGR